MVSSQKGVVRMMGPDELEGGRLLCECGSVDKGVPTRSM